MTWRGSREASRERCLANFDAAGAEDYESMVGSLSIADGDAHLLDLRRVSSLEPGMRVLDVGAGTGTICALLTRVEGLSITALEPAPAMAEMLRRKPGIEAVRVVEGFCDAPEDRSHFEASQFDLIVSRQLVNGLFDPLTAFQNWHHWLEPGGVVLVMDGLYQRSAWSGGWKEEVDVLPLSVCQTTAIVPYLLEATGFRIEAVEPMAAVNELPSTRTPRYMVVGRK